jgi:O-antigen ligase
VTRTDRRVLTALQVLTLVVPLLLGGRATWTVALACPVVLALLLTTLHARHASGGGPATTGIAALAAFVAIALFTTLPLPPFVLRVLSPATARLYADMLPGWPDAGDWSTWRTLAIDPYGVWLEIGRLALAFGVFAVAVAYPWRSDLPGESGEAPVLARLLLTLIAGGAVMALVALVALIAGNGSVLWLSDVPASRTRASGPFVNPNHLAAWLEMIIPVALGYAIAVATRVRRRIVAAAQAGRGMGVNARRAWIAAVISNQKALGLPLAAMAAVLLMSIAHLATGSRAGSAALLVGLAIAAAGIATSARQKHRHSAIPRWVPAAIAAVLVLGSMTTLVLWAVADGDETAAAVSDGVDVNLTSRLAVAAQGRAIVAEHPLFGTGMGSWLHAFRPHQAPPVEGGIWDHAHNDYLELVADSGAAGAAAALAFGVAVILSLLRQRDARKAAAPERHRNRELPPGFELPEWRAALRDASPLRWGLAGGIGAILVHSLVEFGLRMPANLLTLMLVAALLVLANRPRTPATDDGAMLLTLPPAITPPGHAPALAMLAALLVVAAIGPTVDSLRIFAGATPLSPRAAIVASDLVLAEQGDDGRARAIALAHHALDWSPADREAHETAALAAGPGQDGDDEMRRAIALNPWSPELRDALASRLAERGLAEQAAAELEESMFRYPYLVSHDYLSTAATSAAHTPQEMLRALADGDTVPVRLAALDDTTARAIERGLTRALADTSPGTNRAGILNDLASLLEARERFADATTLLRSEAARNQDGRASLARAAKNALRSKDLQTAEETLLAALVDTPEQGRLYRDLAVDVYAARGDFASAEMVLAAGERNALDMLPVHRGMTEFLERRAAAEDDRTASAWAVGVAGDDAADSEESD